jgi:hypothetical protein
MTSTPAGAHAHATGRARQLVASIHSWQAGLTEAYFACAAGMAQHVDAGRLAG